MSPGYGKPGMVDDKVNYMVIYRANTMTVEGRQHMAKKIKRVPPSRTKYEQGHPTVSCRVSREIYDRLMEAKAVEDKSFCDILKIGLGKQEVQAKKVRDARKLGWDEGYQKGYADAVLKYKVIYHCDVCGKEMEAIHENEKKTINQFMLEKGWGHNECHERR